MRTGRLIRAGRLATNVLARPDVRLERSTVRRLIDAAVPQVGRTSRGRDEWLDASWYAGQGIEAGTAGDAARLDDSLRDAFVSSSLPSLLRYEDRNSMAWSRESRVPFLTQPMVDLAFRLPPDHIVAGDGTTKVAFRDAMRGLVPDAILDRKDKIGFNTPRRWHDEIVSRTGALFDDDLGASMLGIDPDALRGFSTGGGQAGRDALWRAINAQRWTQLFEMET